MAKTPKKKTTRKPTSSKSAKATSARSGKAAPKKKAAATSSSQKKKAVGKKAAKQVGKPGSKKASKQVVAKKSSRPASAKRTAGGSGAAAKPAKSGGPAPSRGPTKPAPANASKSKPAGMAEPRPAKAPAQAAAGKKKPAKRSRPSVKPPAMPPRPAGPVHGMRAEGSVHVNGHTMDLPFEELTTAQLKRAKSGLKKADLQFFRAELLERRAEILGDVEGLDAARNNFGGEISNMPLHMADVGSENYDREFNLGLLESEKRLLREIDGALMRIVDGTYGVCHTTGKPIERIRLEIKPWAKYCIEVARERERRGLLT